jgi:hypothetical protein
LTYELRDDLGALVNPGSVTLVITKPDGTTLTPTPTSPGTGLLVYDYPTTAVGRHVATWVTTAPTTADSDTFNVESADPQWIVGLTDVKAHLNIPATSQTHDDELELMIAAATEKIEDRVGPVVRRTVTNERHPGSVGVVYLDEAPVLSVTSVVPVAGGTPVTVGLLDVENSSGRVTYADGRTRFPWGEHFWTYTAGRIVVPAGLQLAALNYVRGSWETQRAASRLPMQGGDELATQPGMGLVVWRLEQDLKPFLRPSAIA